MQKSEEVTTLSTGFTMAKQIWQRNLYKKMRFVLYVVGARAKNLNVGSFTQDYR